MNRYFFIPALLAVCLAGCITSRVTEKEAILFTTAKGSWWIINTILQDSYGKDVHINSLVSMDQAGDKHYAACFAAIWTESGNRYYTTTRIASLPELRSRQKFPLRISFPATDTAGMEWSLVLKRNGLSLMMELNNKTTPLPKGYTELSATFKKQDPFFISAISSLPEAWAIDPLAAHITLNGSMRAVAATKMFIRIFSDKQVLLNKSSGVFMHWLDLALPAGKQLSVLFSTDAASNIKTETALLWDESGKIMARPHVILQKINKDKDQADRPAKGYPLYFSIELPGQHLKLMLRPRMTEQEIAANKNSCWMGAVEAMDERSGLQAGKGNMYIFKQ